MENQEQIDLEFLEQLRQRHIRELASLTTTNNNITSFKRGLRKIVTHPILASITVLSIFLTILISQISPLLSPFSNTNRDILIPAILGLILTILVLIIVIRRPSNPYLSQEYYNKLEQVHTELAYLAAILEEIKTTQRLTNLPEDKPPAKTSYSHISLMSTLPSKHTAEDCDWTCSYDS